MRHSANLISLSRILLSLLMLLFLADKLIFIGILLLCGLSDALDGIVARRTVTSPHGAKLDSIADLVMFSVIVIALVVQAGEQLRGLLPYIIAIFAIRVINMLIAGIKYQTLVMLHTWGNKLTGIMIFLASVVFFAIGDMKVFIAVIILAMLSALEETLIHLTSSKPDLNRRSLLFK